MYAIDDDHMLIIASDRLSAFDVVMPQPIPGKGEVLSRVAKYWFAKTRHLIGNHLSPLALADIVPDAADRQIIGDRATVAKRLQPLPVEAVVRGYVIGSGWKDYQRSGEICGIPLPEGMQQAERLPQPIFTPATKAQAGDHDENITYEQVCKIIGASLAERIRALSLRIYAEAAEYALTRGIIIADTKFEFGLDRQGNLHLIDEVLTPDSSRFWPADSYQTGISPPSYDKQFVRDYLETLDWNKAPPGPTLPEDIIRKTADKYAEAEARLTEDAISFSARNA